MRTKGNTAEDYAAAYDRLGSSKAVAREFGVDESTVRRCIQRLRKSGTKELSSLGYDVAVPDRTPEDAWNSHSTIFERTVSDRYARSDFEIRRKGPFVLAHFTDPHLDDDATPLRLLQADIEASHQLGAIMCHGGDALNNWPMAGKLAKKWAEQSCPLPDALLRAQYYISILKPEAWVDGNHEEMNPYLTSLFDQWLPRKIARDYWRVDFTVKVSGGRDTTVSMSHKFQKGSSWFNPAHGGVREMLEGEDRDIYLEGHLHIDGVMERTLPERGTSSLIVSSAGYKVLDRYAARISRGGKVPKLRGRAHWIVVDPFADEAETRCAAFKSPMHAEAFLSGLQNLRAA